MAGELKPIAPNRFRETFGRHYEDMRIGEVYEHRPGKTVTEAEAQLFAAITLNTHPLHIDREYAAATEFGRPVVCSGFTIALLIGLSQTDIGQKLVADLGWGEVRLSLPVFPGDTLYGETEVLEMRDSQSRPDAGVVTVQTTGRNQEGRVVCTLQRTLLIAKRSNDLETRANY